MDQENLVLQNVDMHEEVIVPDNDQEILMEPENEVRILKDCL